MSAEERLEPLKKGDSMGLLLQFGWQPETPQRSQLARKLASIFPPRSGLFCTSNSLRSGKQPGEPIFAGKAPVFNEKREEILDATYTRDNTGDVPNSMLTAPESSLFPRDKYVKA